MLKPVGKRILVKPIVHANEKIIISAKPTKFLILAVGEEVTRVIAGNTIFMEKFYGIEIDHEGEKYLVIDEVSILAKLD